MHSREFGQSANRDSHVSTAGSSSRIASAFSWIARKKPPRFVRALASRMRKLHTPARDHTTLALVGLRSRTHRERLRFVPLIVAVLPSSGAPLLGVRSSQVRPVAAPRANERFQWPRSWQPLPDQTAFDPGIRSPARSNSYPVDAGIPVNRAHPAPVGGKAGVPVRSYRVPPCGRRWTFAIPRR